MSSKKQMIEDLKKIKSSNLETLSLDYTSETNFKFSGICSKKHREVKMSTLNNDAIIQLINNQFDKIGTDINTRLYKIEVDMNARFDKIETNITEIKTDMNARFDKIETNITEIKTDINLIKSLPTIQKELKLIK